ncbi:MAG: ABC transporter ATP-binding protein [Acidimicrobiales bacterium]
MRGVAVTLGGATILDGVDLCVPTGAWVTVIGPNGAGKTTMLRAAMGLVPAGGVIQVQGHPVSGLRRRERAARIALVPQDPVVPVGMTVGHYVLLGRTARLGPFGRESTEDLAAADRAIERLHLDGLALRSIETLSGGERQRAVIARALAQDAPILVLDEPTSALDVGHQQDVLDLVAELRASLGLTVVAAMHDLTLAAHYADSVVLVRDGVVVADGRPTEVLTTEILQTHYRARIDVIDHHGRLVVVPHPKETNHART